MKRRTKILGLLAALILGQLLFVGPAGADHPYSQHYIKSPTTGRCLLGGQITSHGTGWVGTWPCEASWWLVWQWRGHFDLLRGAPIKGVPEKSCLDSNDRGDVYMLRCSLDYNPNQHWKVYLNGRGYALIKNVGTGRCLEEPSQGGAVQTHGCSDDNIPKQWWRFVSHPAQ